VNRPSARLRKEPEAVMCTQTVQDCQQRAFRLAFRITRNQEDAEDFNQASVDRGLGRSTAGASAFSRRTASSARANADAVG